MTAQPHFKLAESEIGTKEIKGDRDNPEIVRMFADVGHSQIDNDETAWCAAAVGSWLERSGIPSTGALNARSYLNWGTPIDLEDAQPGDIVVFYRGDPKGWQGHVGLYVAHTATTVDVLGGNQGDMVQVKAYARERLLGVRRVVVQGGAPAAGKVFTEELVRALAPRGNNAIVAALPALLNELLPKYQINTPRRITGFLANILTETGGFKTLEENLNYSASRLMAVWPSRFPTMAIAKTFARNPEALANSVYNRYGNRGHQGWGWKYRGRGLMMITFWDNYKKVQDVTGLPLVDDPDLLLDVRSALIAACIFWQNSGCNELTDANRITDCRKVINGGTHGLKQVKGYYKMVLPKVKDIDLTSTAVEKTSGVGAAGAAITAIATGVPWWIVLGGAVVIGLLIAGFIAHKKNRRNNDVRDATAQAEGIQDVPDQLDLDLRGGSDLDLARLDQLSGEH